MQKVVSKKYPLAGGLRASNIHCAHTETFSLAHMMHESQSLDADSAEVIDIPVPESLLRDHNSSEQRCHIVRFYGMDVRMGAQFARRSETVRNALLRHAEIDSETAQVRWTHFVGVAPAPLCTHTSVGDLPGGPVHEDSLRLRSCATGTGGVRYWGTS